MNQRVDNSRDWQDNRTSKPSQDAMCRLAIVDPYQDKPIYSSDLYSWRGNGWWLNVDSEIPGGVVPDIDVLYWSIEPPAV